MCVRVKMKASLWKRYTYQCMFVYTTTHESDLAVAAHVSNNSGRRWASHTNCMFDNSLLIYVNPCDKWSKIKWSMLSSNAPNSEILRYTASHTHVISMSDISAGCLWRFVNVMQCLCMCKIVLLKIMHWLSFFFFLLQREQAFVVVVQL